MPNLREPTSPTPIPQNAGRTLERLVDEARSLAARYGLLMHPAGGTKVNVIPHSLLPSPIPRNEFNAGFDLAHVLTRLIVAVSRDEAFLRNTLRPVAVADPFLTRLLSLLDQPRVNTRIQCTSNRYDFFVGASAECNAKDEHRGLRLVEINSTAAGAAQRADTVAQLHRVIATHPAAVDAAVAVDPDSLPVCHAVACVADTVASAHKAFVEMHRLEHEDVRTVMVVCPPYENICDQDGIRAKLLEDHAIDMPRVALCDVAGEGELDDKGLLRLRGAGNVPPFVVSAAYFRCGYGPEDYLDERAWDSRALLERSATVCVPSAATQLAGTKKLLQVLGERETLERFLGAEDAERVERCLVKQWSLSGMNGEHAAQMAIKNPDDFVLKPQRDGGGYNLFRDDIRKELEGAPPDVRAQYVLQQRIHPRAVRNVIVREGGWEVADVVCELGIFGGAVAVDDVLVVNDTRGHVLRSKTAGVDGGGICTGIAFVDSPRLKD